MVIHFFYDITHFDSKFFETLKDLVTKPGFLSKEYMKGRRASYLHPVKMYVFTSAVFFLLFFSLFSGDATFTLDSPSTMSGNDRLEVLAKIESKLRKDSALRSNDSAFNRTMQKLKEMKDTSRLVTWDDFTQLQKSYTQINLTGQSDDYVTVEQYDSAQKSLPPGKRDNWFKSRLTRKEISINTKYAGSPDAAMEKLKYNILHKLPYMLFVSLPLFAFILQVLYIRRRQFYYADHGIFTIHLYIFSFILLLVVFGLSKLQDTTGWDFLGIVMAILFLGLNVYLYKAMRRFYGQGRFKTFIKFLVTAIISLVMMTLLLLVFLFFSAYEL